MDVRDPLLPKNEHKHYRMYLQRTTRLQLGEEADNAINEPES
jgi:hypothetical protein